jgi:hypothetical protein
LREVKREVKRNGGAREIETSEMVETSEGAGTAGGECKGVDEASWRRRERRRRTRRWREGGGGRGREGENDDHHTQSGT